MAERTLPGIPLQGFWDLGNHLWKTGMDNNMLLLAALTQATVISTTTDPLPGAATDGDKYIVATPGADLGKIAVRDDGAWVYIPPREGFIVWVRDSFSFRMFDGTNWRGLLSGTVSQVGVNSTPDNTNRLTVKSDAVLFSHDDVTPGSGDMRIALNKSAAGKDGVVIFQDGFSTRALFGLLGDDDWTVKVSPDGVAFKTAIIAAKDTGAVSLEQHPKFSAYCNFDKYCAAGVWTNISPNITRHNDQSAFDAGTNLFTAPHDGYYVFGAWFRFKANAAVPTRLVIGLSINGAAPTQDRSVTRGDSTVVTLESNVQVTGMLKLAAGDTVAAMANMVTNDGYVEANRNYFWGHQVA